MIEHIAHYSDTTRVRLLREILLVFVPLCIFGIVGNQLGGDTVWGVATIYLGYGVSIALATYILKQNGTGWQQIGMARPNNLWRTLLLGFGVFVGAIITTMLVQIILINLPTFGEIDESRFNPVSGNLPLLIGMVIAAWTIIAFGEEMLWRAFLMTRLDELIGQSSTGQGLVVLIGAIGFGFAHYVEGPVGILSTAAIGMVFVVAFLRSNLWVTIIAHGLLNTLRFTILYFVEQS